MMQTPLVLLTIAMALRLFECADVKLPFKKCSRKDPNLGQCIADSLNGAKETIAKGVPELGLPSLTPLFVEKIGFIEESNLHAAFYNFTWHGQDDYTVTTVKVDFDKKKVTLQFFYPKTHGEGQYRIRGNILTFKINENGPYTFDMNGVNATHDVDVEEYQRRGKPYWRVKKYWVTLSSNEFTFNATQGRLANPLVNTNLGPLMQIYKEVIGEAIGGLYQQFADSFLKKVPLHQLFDP